MNSIAIAALALLAGIFLALMGVFFYMALKTIREAAAGVQALGKMVKDASVSMSRFGELLTKLRDSTLQSLDNRNVIGAIQVFPHLAAIGTKLAADLETVQKALAVLTAVVVKNDKAATDSPAPAQTGESEFFRYQEDVMARREEMEKSGVKEDIPGVQPEGVTTT